MGAKELFFQETLEKPFRIEQFVKFSLEFFNNLQIIKPDTQYKDYSKWTEFSFHIAGYHHIANFGGSDNAKIAIFAVQLKDPKNLDRARSLQRNFVKKLISSVNLDGAFVAFYADNETKWRLSFIKLDYEFAMGNVAEKITPAKRYSYLVGKGEPCHTAMERLYPIFINEETNPSIAEIEEAFSVEKVTKEFFEKYKEKYFDLKEHLDSNQDFVSEAKRQNFTSEQFAKKLMGQIAFLYFIQKKGWLGVNSFPKTKTPYTKKEYDKLFFLLGKKSREAVPKVFVKSNDDEYVLIPEKIKSLSQEEQETLAIVFKGQSWGTGPRKFIRKLFDLSVKNNENFYDDYLEPLFYEALNKKRGASDYYHKLNCRIPFLNGGLFEPLDNYDWEKNDFAVPNYVFSNIDEKGTYDADGILDVFDRYNFTMNEDEPLEKEVAVDPEMLGKVFENLLEGKDRKAKGAFYTPREIVHYMCQESIINFLVGKTGISYDAIKDFIIYGEFIKDEDTSREASERGELFISEEILNNDRSTNRLKDIDDALANIKVADPAVGSGAFPLGMISEIVRARRNITEYLAMIIKETTESKNQAAHIIRMMHQADRHPLNLKLQTIKNSIFAVDIEPSAVDIAKLRLWLSLVVEQEINEDNDDDGIYAESKNPRPLPNLDCNILCGNSLIEEIGGEKLINDSELLGKEQYQTIIGQNQYESLLNQLFDAQNKLFNEDNHEKKEELKRKIRARKDAIVMLNITKMPEVINKYNAVKNKPSPPYFLWKLEFARVFRENGGFDVVIGNPPYVSTKGVDDADKKLLLNEYGFSDDTYSHFFFKGHTLLTQGGNLTYITPKTFWTTQTKRNLRDLLLNNTINYIYDTANPFEAAMVDTCITSIQKTDINNDTVIFLDGSKSLIKPQVYTIDKARYVNTQNSVIFKPTPDNLKVNTLLGIKVKELYTLWWDKISTSKNIEKNKSELEDYRNSLRPGDIALLGCLTEGGQGLATANNGKYIAVRKSSKWAKNIEESRPKKLEAAIKQYKIDITEIEGFSSAVNYLATHNETEIVELFDKLKEKYGRDIFGQGYIYRLIEDDEIADIDTLTEEEKQNGISKLKKHYVPYDKGDKDGNRWYLETPFAIAWSQENVGFLKTDPKARYQGYTFYFKEGFCWSDINTTFLKCRQKQKSINDVKSMSLYTLTDKCPEYYIICLINSTFMSYYVDSFVNNTQTFQINDARQLPIYIPSTGELEKLSILFNRALGIKQKQFAFNIEENEAMASLNEIQAELDKTVEELYGIV